jgi:hypothetical protein
MSAGREGLWAAMCVVTLVKTGRGFSAWLRGNDEAAG